MLADSYPGEEGRYRYAALLRKQQRHAEARGVLKSSLSRAKLMPGYYRRKEQARLKAARSELAKLGELRETRQGSARCQLVAIFPPCSQRVPHIE